MSDFDQIMERQDRCRYVYDNPNGLVCLRPRKGHEREHEFKSTPETTREAVSRWWRSLTPAGRHRRA